MVKKTEKKNNARTKIPYVVNRSYHIDSQEIPIEVLRQSKSAKKEEIIPFIMTYNPNNPYGFPTIKQCQTFFRGRILLTL